MKILETVAAIRSEVRDAKSSGRVVGLVPTMGALHEGHLSLVRRADEECGLVVCSVFVNPLQFAPNEDLDAYPRDLAQDASLAGEAGADVVFAPPEREVYPVPNLTDVYVRELSSVLCGVSRPTHFKGVATVVAKLFNMVQPDRAYFGRKDAQQLAVIERLTSDLNFPVEVVPCPTVREGDGLAMSSRNLYMDEDERAAAPALYRGLMVAADLAEQGVREADRLEKAVLGELECQDLITPEYVELRDATTLAKTSEVPDDGSLILAVAARVAKPGNPGARIIDNFRIEVSGGAVRIDSGVFSEDATLLASGGRNRAGS